MKLLLDEHFSPDLARRLRDLGHDVVAVVEAPELVGLADPDLFARALASGRALVTENVRDFAPLATQHQLELLVPGRGLIFTSHARFPRSAASLGKLLKALDARLRDHPGDARVGVTWLQDPEPG